MTLQDTGKISHSDIMEEWGIPANTTWKLSADGGPLINYPSGQPKVKESDFYGASSGPNNPLAPELSDWRTSVGSSNVSSLDGSGNTAKNRYGKMFGGSLKSGGLVITFSSRSSPSADSHAAHTNSTHLQQNSNQGLVDLWENGKYDQSDRSRTYQIRCGVVRRDYHSSNKDSLWGYGFIAGVDRDTSYMSVVPINFATPISDFFLTSRYGGSPQYNSDNDGTGSGLLNIPAQKGGYRGPTDYVNWGTYGATIPSGKVQGGHIYTLWAHDKAGIGTGGNQFEINHGEYGATFGPPATGYLDGNTGAFVSKKSNQIELLMFVANISSSSDIDQEQVQIDPLIIQGSKVTDLTPSSWDAHTKTAADNGWVCLMYSRSSTSTVKSHLYDPANPQPTPKGMGSSLTFVWISHPDKWPGNDVITFAMRHNDLTAKNKKELSMYTNLNPCWVRGIATLA